MMGAVVGCIKNLGINVEHIPGGYTSLRQSVDVCIIKPLNDLICKLWMQWMIDNCVQSDVLLLLHRN